MSGVTAWGLFAAFCIGVLALVIAVAWNQGYSAGVSDQREEETNAAR